MRDSSPTAQNDRFVSLWGERCERKGREGVAVKILRLRGALRQSLRLQMTGLWGRMDSPGWLPPILRGKNKYEIPEPRSRMTSKGKCVIPRFATRSLGMTADRSGLQPSGVLNGSHTWGFAPGWYRSRRWRSKAMRGFFPALRDQNDKAEQIQEYSRFAGSGMTAARVAKEREGQAVVGRRRTCCCVCRPGARRGGRRRWRRRGW